MKYSYILLCFAGLAFALPQGETETPKDADTLNELQADFEELTEDLKKKIGVDTFEEFLEKCDVLQDDDEFESPEIKKHFVRACSVAKKVSLGLDE